MKLKTIAGALAAAMVVAGCSGDGGESQRSVAMTSIADDIIIPGYEAAATSASEASDAVEAFCLAPNATTNSSATQAVTDARYVWAATEAMWIGPVMTERLSPLVDYAIDPEGIDEVVTDDSVTLDERTISSRVAAGQRGLSAAEYVLDQSQAGGQPTERQCKYLTAVVAVAANTIDEVVASWKVGTEGNVAYRTMFIGEGGESLDNSLNSYVNDSFDLLRVLSNLDSIEEGPGADGVAVTAARLRSAEVAMLGNERSEAMSALLSPELNERLATAFGNASASLDQLGASIEQAKANDPQSVEVAEAAIEEVRRIETTEVVAELGVTVGFSDADGDSAG